jgi:hypothetical protein
VARWPIDDVLLYAVIPAGFLPFSISGFRLAHFIAMPLAAISLYRIRNQRLRSPLIVALLFLSILTISTLSAAYHGTGHWLTHYMPRDLICYGTAFAVGLAQPPERIYAALRISPAICVVFLAAIFLFTHPFSYDGRLQIADVLFSNTLGFLILLNIAVIMSVPHRRWGQNLVLVILWLALILTFSRAALFAAIAFVWIRIGLIRGALIVLALAAAGLIILTQNPIIQRLLVLQDIRETGGSGRVWLWTTLINNMWNSPSSWLFGFGLGSVHFPPQPWRDGIEKGHSLYFDTLYAYGLAGVTLLASVLAMTWRRLASMPASPMRALARDILLAVMIAGSADTSFFDPEINGYFAVYFAFCIALLRASLEAGRENSNAQPKQSSTALPISAS